jgi:phage-related protein
MADKPLQWLGSSRRDVRAFPRAVRRLAGIQLRRVQRGLDPIDWKPMGSVGPGVREIRIHTAVEHRVLYVAKFAEAVSVLHAFAKRTARTPKHEVQVARQRFEALLAWRRSETAKGR